MEQSIIDYIRKTKSQGFSESEIRQALVAAGWTNVEIQDGFIASGKPKKDLNEEAGSGEKPAGFFARHSKKLIIILIIIVALPALAYGGYLGYKQISKPEGTPAPVVQPQNNAETQAPAPSENELMTQRDRQRVKDIGWLQTALAKYYETNKVFPKTLDELAASSTSTIPLDPKTQKSYLYTTMEEPPLHYSLTFILEGPVASLPSGITVVTDEKLLPADIIDSQEQVVKGEKIQTVANDFQITDLSKTTFKPQEEVSIELTPPSNVEFSSVHLLLGDMFLSDRSLPFGFSFTAPKNPGTYEVKIFGFDKAGNSYFQKTTLTVE